MIREWILQILLLIVSILGGSAVWYYITQKLFHHALWIGFCAAILLLLIISLYIRNDILKKEIKVKQSVYFGELVPDNKPSPPLPAGVPKNTISLLLGDDLRVLAAQSENYIFSKNGEAFLSIGIKNGLMTVSLSIMDSNNKNVVRIVNNEFKAFPENTFNPKQPDRHSLTVRDSKGIEVLNIRFINPKAIRIVGRFHIPGFKEPVLILPDEGIRWPGGRGGISHLTIDLTESKVGLIAF